jgi:hypothetical protein
VYLAFFNKGDSRVRNLSIIFAVSLLVPITIIANNNFFSFGTDQTAFLRKVSVIVETGRFESWRGYYDPFPFLSLLLTSLTLVTGFNTNPYAFLAPVGSLLVALVLYLTFIQIRKSERTASIAPFIIMSIPPLAFLSMIPKYFSTIFGFTCLYLMIKVIYSKSKSFILSLYPILIAMVVLHPSGPVFVLCLLSPLGIYSVIMRRRSAAPHQFRSMTTLILAVMLTYWIFNHSVLLSVRGPIRDLFTTITNYLSGSQQLSVQSAARPYLESSIELAHTAYAWAVPPALVAAYLLNKFHNILIDHKYRKRSQWMQKIIEFGSVLGLTLLMLSFLLAYYGHYSYIIIPTYAILTFLILLILPHLLSCKNEIVTLITVFILATSVFVGSSSPNWAPIENPDFPQRRMLYNQAFSTKQFCQNLPQNTLITLILDFDAYPKIPEDLHIKIFGSYRVIRRILMEFEKGIPIDELAADNTYIFIVRVERLVLHREDAFNLVRSSGKHAMITPIRYIANETLP